MGIALSYLCIDIWGTPFNLASARRDLEDSSPCSSKSPPSQGPWLMRPQQVTPLGTVLELFSGCGALSRCFCKLGYVAEAWDIQYNSSCDLSNPIILKGTLNRINSHEFAYVHLGTPCTSWSRARRCDGKGPGPLRDDQDHLYGLPHFSLSDQDKTELGNLLLKISAEIFQTCINSGVAVSLENPASSRMWLTVETKALQQQGAVFQRTTFCAYGTPWGKATSFLTYKCPNFCLARCSGPFKTCSFPGCRRVPLT